MMVACWTSAEPFSTAGDHGDQLWDYSHKRNSQLIDATFLPASLRKIANFAELFIGVMHQRVIADF